MPQALYRRYRPETFADVIGQEHVTTPLRHALANQRFHHAYLFSGPRGCGKTTSARILARCLNCAQGPTPDPCGVCESCVALARGGSGSIDVIEIDAASHGGVDDARELREKAFFAPAASRFKVYIIDEAHMVSSAGFNALLKLVEEPPEHVKFVFATTEPDKVIGTIRSRTHHYPFRLIPPRELQRYLGEVCEREGVRVDKGVLQLVVRAGRGSARDALSVLDQLVGGAGPEGVTYGMAAGLLGYTDAALLDDAIESFAAHDAAAVLTVVDQVVEGGLDPRRFGEDLLERLRDLIVVHAVPDAAAGILSDLAEDQLDRMRQQAARFGPAQLSRAADIVNAGLIEMRGATAPRLQLELICARVLLPAASGDEASLAARLERLERRLAAGAAPAPDAAASRAPAATPQPPAATGAPAAPHAPAATRAPADAPAPPATRPTSTASVPDVPPGDDVPAPDLVPETGPDLVPGPAPDRDVPATPGRDRPDEPGPDRPRAPEVPPPAGALDVAAVRRMWPDVLARLAGLKRATWTLVKDNAVIAAFEPGRLTLALSSAGLREAFSRGAHPDYVHQALIDVLGLDVAVEAIVDPSASGGVPDAVGQSSAAARPAPGRATPPEPADDRAPLGRTPGGAPPRVPVTRGAPAGAGARPEPTGDGPDGGRTAGPDGPRAAAGRPERPAAGRPERPAAAPTVRPEDDEASADDPDDDAGLTGVALLQRDLGATVIREIDDGP